MAFSTTTMTIKSGLQSRRSILKGHLKNAIRRRKVGSREMKIGKPVDLHITSECECVICMETLSAKNIAVTPCGHKFCFTCIAENLTISKACPLCRATIGKEQQKKEMSEEIFDEIMMDCLDPYIDDIVELANDENDDENDDLNNNEDVDIEFHHMVNSYINMNTY